MSPKRTLTVAEVVEKYKVRFSTEIRADLRRRIRIEHPELFKDNLSNLRKLDRQLKKAFEKEQGKKCSSKTTYAKEGWNPIPDFAFSPKFEDAHRKIREPFEVDLDEPPKFPAVPFNWHNWSPYQLRVRLEVQVFLGGGDLGLIYDPKGYYNGKASIPVEPYIGRLRDGRFTLPGECAESTKETTIEVRARILDQNDSGKKEYVIIKSWTYDPTNKDWFYEPKSFSEEALKSSESFSSGIHR